MQYMYTIASVLLVSIISVVAAIPLLLKKKLSDKLLIVLLSVSVGTLLGGVFIHFLPEIAEQGYTPTTGIYILSGFLVFFLLEKFVHFHHNHKKLHDAEKEAHSHAYHLAPINLIGDGMHNFLDGLVIAGSYAVSIPLGVAATVSVIFHEIPQELADFGVLLYAGMSKKKALIFNLLSAVTSIIGAIIGIALAGTQEFTTFIIPFAAGTFLYIAASNLLPELHRHCKLRDTLVHTVAIITGIAFMVVIAVLLPH